MRIKTTLEKTKQNIDKALCVKYVQGYARNMGAKDFLETEEAFREQIELWEEKSRALCPRTEIGFSWGMDMGSTFPNAVSYPLKKKIQINCKWLSMLICEPSELVEKAFFLTLAHEYMHILYDWKKPPEHFMRGKNRVFFLFLTEVRADLKAVEWLGYSIAQAQMIMNYKAELKGATGGYTRLHPSMQKRAEYLSYIEFDDKIIEKVASDLQICDASVIREMKDYFLK